MRIELCRGDTMTDKEYEKAWINEEFKPRKLTEEEIYEWYLERISAPAHPILLSKEECDAYNAEHPLPTEKDIERILKEAGET